jgi:hypothetical protein
VNRRLLNAQRAGSLVGLIERLSFSAGAVYARINFRSFLPLSQVHIAKNNHFDLALCGAALTA